MSEETTQEATEAPVFRAVLTPHRSLGKPGFLIVMGLIVLVSFTAGIIFMLHGAWPVSGFLGLDAMLVYIALKLSYHGGRLTETVELSEDRLTVRRTSPSGEVTSWEFQPYWLRIEFAKPDEHDSPLVLTSHGRSVSVGAFLSATERLEFAHALREALRQLDTRFEPTQSG